MEDENKGTAVMVGVGVQTPEKVSFSAPEGMDVADMKAGDEKEVLAKVRYDGSGGFELVSVDGYPIDEEEEMPEGMPEEDEEMAEEASYASTLADRARESGMM